MTEPHASPPKITQDLGFYATLAVVVLVGGYMLWDVIRDFVANYTETP